MRPQSAHCRAKAPTKLPPKSFPNYFLRNGKKTRIFIKKHKKCKICKHGHVANCSLNALAMCWMLPSARAEKLRSNDPLMTILWPSAARSWTVFVLDTSMWQRGKFAIECYRWVLFLTRCGSSYGRLCLRPLHWAERNICYRMPPLGPFCWPAAVDEPPHVTCVTGRPCRSEMAKECWHTSANEEYKPPHVSQVARVDVAETPI